MLRTMRLVCAGLAVALIGVAIPAVGAATTTSGTGTFTGAVSLPSFPCGTCNSGTLSGQVALTLSGMSASNVPYTAAWPAPLPPSTNVTASFAYSESCLDQPDGTPPLQGTAGGTFNLTGGTAIVGGQLMADAVLTGNINWTRDGLAASIQFTNLVITAGSNNSTIAVNLADSIAGVTIGQGGAGFVWTNGPGVCGGVPQQPQTAEIAGVALQPA